MSFLIELYGDAKSCTVIPTCGRKYSYRKSDEYFIGVNLVCEAGFDGFIRSHNCKNVHIKCIAFGMKTYVQVELPYPWSKHQLISNVTIKSYCKNGYLYSIAKFIKHKIINLLS